MHTDPKRTLHDAEELLQKAKQVDPIASNTDSLKEMELKQAQSTAAKAKQALNEDTGRTRLKNTNTDNQYKV